MLSPVAVVFDIDGVLIDTASMIRAGQRRVEELLGLSSDSDEAQFHDAWRNLAVVLGSRITPFFLNCLAEEFRLRGRPTTDSWLLHGGFIQDYWRAVRPTPSARDVLQWLKRKGIKRAILSDGEEAAQIRKLRDADLFDLFDPSLIEVQASDSHLAKPNPAMLRQLVSRMQAKASEVAYIGDRESDVLVAKLSGCFAVRLADGKEHPNVYAQLRSVREVAANHLRLAVPDLTVDSLIALKNHIS